MDDYCPKRGLRGEHGLSLYIEAGSTKLLFDTGQSDAFMANARSLGIDLSSLDAVVLSHGHYDHGGGLNALFGILKDDPPPLFVGRGFDAQRIAKEGDSRKDIGLPRPFLPEQMPPPIEIGTAENLARGLFILPSAEMVYETNIDPRFRRVDGGAELPDLFEDELSLVAVEGSGLVIITGCAHRGILNIVKLTKVALALAAFDAQAVYCSHCTGLLGFVALNGAQPGRVRWLSYGTMIDL